MRKNYEAVGPVRTLVQRKQYRHAASPLSHHRDFDATRFEYDAENRAVRSITVDEKGMVLSTSHFEYEPNRRKEVRRDANALVSRICSNELDDSRPLVLASFLEDGTPLTRKVFEYREGKLVGSVGTYWGFDGSESHRWITYYDDFERIQRTHGEKADGSPLGDGRYKYEYSENGRLWKVWIFDEFENKATSVETYTYSDDAHENWIEKRGIRQWRNDARQTSRVTTRELSYYE